LRTVGEDSRPVLLRCSAIERVRGADSPLRSGMAGAGPVSRLCRPSVVAENPATRCGFPRDVGARSLGMLISLMADGRP
jgi:hypothetical protein